MNQMEQYYQNVLHKKSDNVVWFLEHPLIYTMGNACKENPPNILPIYKTKRGGLITHHGPGQLIIYFAYHAQNIHTFINMIESVIIKVLEQYNIKAYPHEGIWINGEKIASIGLHIRKNIVTHGVALNINPDLSYFNYITPCGVKDCKMTSLKKLGLTITRQDIEKLIQNLLQTLLLEQKYPNNYDDYNKKQKTCV